MFPDASSSPIGRIHVLEPGQDVWDAIRGVAYSGVQEEAFYVFDVGDIVRKHKEWKLNLPRVRPFYAVKCNDNRTVLEVLASLGASFDCASKIEIAKVLDLGVETDRIIFANPAKQQSHIRYASAVNVRTMTFDSETELYKVKENHPTAKMVLRIRCDAKKAEYPLGSKFGADPNHAPRLIALALELDIDLVGISFHVGSGCGEPEVFHRAISIASNLFNLAAEMGINMTLLDLGGGFSGNRGSSIGETACIINDALDQFFPAGCGVDVIAEPGTYYVASAFTLATQVHSRRELTNKEDGTTSYMYYINDGLYGSFELVHYVHEALIPKPLNSVNGQHYRCSIWGPTCDSVDQVAANAYLPLMDVGDWIIFEDMGAYTVSIACTFNGFPVPEVFPVAHQHTYLYLKDCSPFTESHFVMGAPTLTPQEVKHSKSCAVEVNSTNLPSTDSSVSIASLDTDRSDDVSGDSNNHASCDNLVELFDVSHIA